MKSHPTLALLTCLTLSACDFSCASIGKAKPPVPRFDENYAYEQILRYEKLGPQIPGSPGSEKTAAMIKAELTQSGALVLEQKTTAKTFDGKTIPVLNLMAQYNPSAQDRILLSAHWDTRPFSDEDPNPKMKHLPVPGVNDGGSGVVVLLGIAKALKLAPPTLGVDLLFLDAEDWGNPSKEESYCLGTQYWAKNPIPEKYTARFGINFDMVGRTGAVFPIESYSAQRAPEVIQKVRSAAHQLGYDDFFPNFRVGFVTDDHVYLMNGRGFPVMDLIHMTEQGRFPPEWHTHLDTSEFISRDVLKVVGQTTLQVLWNE